MEAFQERVPSEPRPPLDVCQILQEEDLTKSCESLSKNFINNVVNTAAQITRNLDLEWEDATKINPNLLTSETIEVTRLLQKELEEHFQYFIAKCSKKQEEAFQMLRTISKKRRKYLLKLSQFNETLREFVMNETPENRTALTQLEIEKDSLRIAHNELLLDYNHRILGLQLELDNFKQGIIIKEGPNPNQKQTILFYKQINDLRSFNVFPDETTDQIIARDTKFNSWKEQLKLPSNWLIEVGTPQPDVSPFDGSNLIDTDSRTYLDLSNMPSTSAYQEPVPSTSNEREFNISSPDFNPITIPSPSGLDEIQVPSPHLSPHLSPHPSPHPSPQPSSRPSSRLSSRSEISPSVMESISSLGSDEFRPKSTIRDTPLHRKHIDNENLLRRIKRVYWKIHHRIDFYANSDPFTAQYRAMEELNTTIEGLSREWKSIRVTEQDESRTRDETTDRSRPEQRSQNVKEAQVTIQLINQMYNEWMKAIKNLRTHTANIDNNWTRITQLQKELENLYKEIEEDNENEQLLNREEVINKELVALHKNIHKMRTKITTLLNIIAQKRAALGSKIEQLRHKLLRKKAKLESKIAHAQVSRD